MESKTIIRCDNKECLNNNKGICDMDVIDIVNGECYSCDTELEEEEE